MRSVKTYSLQFVLVACASIAAIFLAYRYWGEYPRELAAVEAHQERELASLRQGLQQNREQLLSIARDWAHWDDTYAFIQSPSNHEAYVESNVVKETFSLFNLVGIGYYDMNLEPILRRGFNVQASQWVPFEQVMPKALSELLVAGQSPDSVTGWVLTDQGPAEFALEHITTSAEDQAPAGYLLFVRHMSQSQLHDLQAITRLKVSLQPADSPGAVAAVLPLSHDGLVEGIQTDRQRLLSDPTGAPVAVLSITHDPIATPRAIGAEQLFLLVGLMMVPLLTVTVIDRVLVRPLRRNTSRLESMIREESMELLPQEMPVYELEQIRGAFNRLVHQVQSQQAHLTELSLTDALTHIPNRRALDWSADSLWRQAMRLRQSFLFVLLDVDYFKEFNDELGHPEGDKALQAVARTLTQFSRRSGDFCARMGGEEFALVAVGLDEREARRWIEELREAIEGLGIPHPGSRISSVLTVSVGVIFIVEPSGDEADTSIADLVRQADAALYEAKGEGRNRVKFRFVEGCRHSA